MNTEFSAAMLSRPKPVKADSLSADLLCPFCSRLITNATAAGCTHSFCHSCLINRQKNADKLQQRLFCPTCSQCLSNTFSEPSAQLKNKLHMVEVHCSAGCGDTLLYGDLMAHLTHDCPKGPVPCQYRSKGCNQQVIRSMLEEHEVKCDWRPAKCEYCTKQLIHKDLCLHYHKAGCLDRHLKTQMNVCRRRTVENVKDYKRALKCIKHEKEQHERRRIRDHNKQMERPDSSRAVKRQTRNYIISNALELERIISAPSSTTSLLTSRISEGESITSRLVFSSFSENSEDEMFLCGRCHKMIARSRNNDGACCWHQGPIRDLYGGTCEHCGRLDYEEGCYRGKHISFTES